MNTSVQHHDRKTRHVRRVGNPGGKLYSIYNRGPATLKVKNELPIHAGCIRTFFTSTQPVIQPLTDEVDSHANFTVVTYF